MIRIAVALEFIAKELHQLNSPSIPIPALPMPRWSDDERRILKEMCLKGCRVKEISNRLGRSESAVRSQAIKMNLKYQN